MRCWLVARAITSACAAEQLCGTTRLTPTPTRRPLPVNTAAPKGPPLRWSTFRRESWMARAMRLSSSGYNRWLSTSSWIQAGRVRWSCAYSMSAALFHRPGVAQGDGAVEHRCLRTVVVAVGDEIAQALELEAGVRRRRRRRRLQPAGQDPGRIRVEVGGVGLAAGFVVRVRGGEQAVVEAELGRHRMRGAEPVDGALDLAVGAFHARPRFRIQPATQLEHVAGGVLDHLVAADDAGAAQARPAARDPAPEG